MKIIADYKTFEALTQPIENFEIELLDLVPDAITGLFWPKRLDELMKFCQKNPTYHIYMWKPMRLLQPQHFTG
jgi:hypothetical protein